MKTDIDIVILAGGLGKRLKKIHKNLPKPLIRIGGVTFLDMLINYWAHYGFRRFILCIGYKGYIIKDYYERNKKEGIDIEFSYEKEPLGTAGAVKKARGLIKSNPFVVLNGDSFCRCNPVELLKFHRRHKALVSMVLTESSSGKDYGEIKLDNCFHIESFNEKNVLAGECLINAGIYVFDNRIFEFMVKQKRFSLERDFFPQIVDNNFFGYINDGFFIDIGTPSRYKKAGSLFVRQKFFKKLWKK